MSTTVRELLTAAKAAAIDYPLQEALRYRWSPRAFADRPVEPETLRQLVEAARWAPSVGNGQPWSFMIAAVRQAFDIPDGQEPVVAMALGYPGDPEALPDDLRARELAPRTRKPLADFVFRGRVGQPSPLVADHDDAVS